MRENSVFLRMRFAAVLLLCFLLIPSGFAGQRQPAVKLEVNLRNLTEKPSYSLKDSVVLNIEILNSGTEPVGVYSKLGMGYMGGIILHVLDRQGAEIQPTILQHDFLDSRAMNDAANYFALQPYDFFGTRQEFKISEFVSKSGHYKLLAEYHSPIVATYAKVANFWSIDRKSIVSNEIALTVQ